MLGIEKYYGINQYYWEILKNWVFKSSSLTNRWFIGTLEGELLGNTENLLFKNLRPVVFLSSFILSWCWQWTGNSPICKSSVTVPIPTEEIVLHAEQVSITADGADFCSGRSAGWHAGHRLLTSKRSQSPETVSYSLKVVRTAKIKHPKTIRNLEWNKKGEAKRILLLCICVGDAAYLHIGGRYFWSISSGVDSQEDQGRLGS